MSEVKGGAGNAKGYVGTLSPKNKKRIGDDPSGKGGKI